MKRIAVIPGDGIGVDVTRQAVKLLTALHDAGRVDVVLDDWPLGAERTLRTGITITDEEMGRLRTEYDAIFLGAVGDPRIPDNRHARDILLGLRFKLDLYINLRPVRLYAPELSPLKGVRTEDLDLVIFRENTEGVYVGMGGTLKKDTPEEVATEVDVNTRGGVERIIRAAFEYALLRGRRRVTLTDKANAMPNVGGLWRRTFAAVQADYPGIDSEAVYADALAFDLIRRPARYDVVVAPNLFGDLLSDLAAALAGGLGLAASANLHPGRPGLFEPVHGSAPDIAGTGEANPLAALLTTALMLEQLGWGGEAEAVEAAVRDVLSAGATTPDLGGGMNTDQVGDAVVARVVTASV